MLNVLSNILCRRDSYSVALACNIIITHFLILDILHRSIDLKYVGNMLMMDLSHLDDEGGDGAGVGGAGVGDLDVLEAGVVDHLAPLVPVDVGRGTRAVTNQRSVL